MVFKLANLLVKGPAGIRIIHSSSSSHELFLGGATAPELHRHLFRKGLQSPMSPGR
jgi:hypothetical protein